MLFRAAHLHEIAAAKRVAAGWLQQQVLQPQVGCSSRLAVAAGIAAAGVPQQVLRRQVFRPQDALSAVWQRARWRHAICAVL